MQITVLGSGTSHGVPMIGCTCPVCTSTNPRNRRMRTSGAFRLGERVLLVDTTPELRLQATAVGLDRVDAVLFSHPHADHIMGFDELRRFAELAHDAIPVYAAPETMARLQHVFEYALIDPGFNLFGVPVVEWNPVGEPFDLWEHRVTPVRVEHGLTGTWGVRVDAPDGASAAWVPDCRAIPPESMALLRGLDVLFIDALRHRPHPTHLTVGEALDLIRRLGPRHAWLIHMAHDLDHDALEAELEGFEAIAGAVRPAWDGLVVEVPGRGSLRR